MRDGGEWRKYSWNDFTGVTVGEKKTYENTYSLKNNIVLHVYYLRII